ncbi:hypothetical protein BDV59DRAFT_188210 [Aspergillus ambiguus]|uniref:uncharacterized protein n=1 Tax=Aspergillus ambiguus TaxID=176160 RepID=UPI003CCD0E5A
MQEMYRRILFRPITSLRPLRDTLTACAAQSRILPSADSALHAGTTRTNSWTAVLSGVSTLAICDPVPEHKNRIKRVGNVHA